MESMYSEPAAASTANDSNPAQSTSTLVSPAVSTHSPSKSTHEDITEYPRLAQLSHLGVHRVHDRNLLHARKRSSFGLSAPGSVRVDHEHRAKFEKGPPSSRSTNATKARAGSQHTKWAGDSLGTVNKRRTSLGRRRASSLPLELMKPTLKISSPRKPNSPNFSFAAKFHPKLETQQFHPNSDYYQCHRRPFHEYFPYTPCSETSLLNPSQLLALHAFKLAETNQKIVLYPTSLTPPITISTLRELNLQQTLKSAQIRHDLTFDANLMFRPNVDGHRGEKKRILAQEFWIAVQREIENDCRCTSFHQHNLLECICQNNLKKSLPRRIPILFQEMREIILSILPYPQNSLQRKQIFQLLDVNKLDAEMQRGEFDFIRLSCWLGQLLKLHCAPMRDNFVDTIVKTCSTQPNSAKTISNGLKQFFQLLELMRLDIANHELKILRPLLVRKSVEFEKQVFAQESNENVGEAKNIKPQQLTPTAAFESILNIIFEPTLEIPTAFKLDFLRLKNLQREISNLSFLHLIILLYSQLIHPIVPNVPELTALGIEFECLLGTLNSFTSLESQQRISDVSLHLARKVGAAKGQETALFSSPDAQVVKLVEAYLQTHLCSHSSLFQLLKNRIRASLKLAIELNLTQEAKQILPWWQRNLTRSINSNTPIAISHQIRVECSLKIPPGFVNPAVIAPPVESLSSRGRKRSSEDLLEGGAPENKRLRMATNGALDDEPKSAPQLGQVLKLNGLTPFAKEIESLADRVSKLASFHAAVHA